MYESHTHDPAIRTVTDCTTPLARGLGLAPSRSPRLGRLCSIWWITPLSSPSMKRTPVGGSTPTVDHWTPCRTPWIPASPLCVSHVTSSCPSCIVAWPAIIECLCRYMAYIHHCRTYPQTPRSTASGLGSSRYIHAGPRRIVHMCYLVTSQPSMLMCHDPCHE